MTADRYACSSCLRTDLLITQTSNLRKHSADGKKITSDNPACPGSGAPPASRYDRDDTPAEAAHDLPHDRQPPVTEPDVCPTEHLGIHAYVYGECTCGAEQPGYVAPPPAVNGRRTASGAGPGSFLMGGTGGALSAAQRAESMGVLMAEDPPDDGTDRLYKNGRYALPDPVTGNPRTWTRATTMAGTISDLYSLNLWKIRMVIIGLCRAPELLDDLRDLDLYDPMTDKGQLDPKIHKDMLNAVGFRAQALAGAKVPANWGTELHWNIERLSRDEITLDDVPDKYRDEVASWAAAMADNDLSPVPDLVERRVVVPTYGTAGTLDQAVLNHRTRSIRIGKRVVRINAGDHLIGDVKTGRDLDYGWGEIAIQMSLYAHGAREGKIAVWNPDTEDGEGAWEWRKIGIPPKSIRDDVGVVMHMPIGSKTCTLHWIDLAEGWSAVQLCDQVRDWRKIKGLNTPFSIAEVPTEAPATAPTVRAPSWKERFSGVTSKDQGRALVREYLEAGGSKGPALDRLVQLAKDHMRQLAESTA